MGNLPIKVDPKFITVALAAGPKLAPWVDDVKSATAAVANTSLFMAFLACRGLRHYFPLSSSCS